MKVAILTNGTIAVDGDISKATVTEIDDIMRQISELLGRKLLAGKLSGYWLIRDANAQVPLYGHRGERTRKFDRALAGALGVAVSSYVPFK